jgi:hypothetical protein
VPKEGCKKDVVNRQLDVDGGWVQIRVGLCSACEGKASVQHGEGGRRDGRDGMGWYGRAGDRGTVQRAARAGGCGSTLRQQLQVLGRWVVVWAEFDLHKWVGCWSERGRRAGGSWELGAGGGQSRQRSASQAGEDRMWRAAHTHTRTRNRSNKST